MNSDWCGNEISSYSPQMEAIRMKSSPSPEASLLPPPVDSPSPESDHGKKSRRKRIGNTRADAVLFRFMSNGNYLEVPNQASEQSLTDPTATSVTGESDEEMEEPEISKDQPETASNEPPDSKANEEDIAQATSDHTEASQINTTSTAAKRKASASSARPPANAEPSEPHQQYSFLHRNPAPILDDVISPQVLTRPELVIDSAKSDIVSGSQEIKASPADSGSHYVDSPISGRPHSRRNFDHIEDDDSIAASPNLREHMIFGPDGFSGDRLPRPQHSPTQSMKSPIGPQTLPSLQSIQLGALGSSGPPILESPISLNGASHHSRSPFPPVNGPSRSPPSDFTSPRSSQWHFGQTRTSNFGTYPATEPSPASTTTSGASPRDLYRISHDPTSMSPPGKLGPRPIQASAPTPQSEIQTPLSADSQQSMSSFSTETSPGRERMSIDRERPVQPAPAGSEPLIGGGFKCDFNGCTAAPFQTQYLLNSHANVHSQDRPHYCSVKSCPRSEAGKGFKRKNEMIRHGLVHQSPGYICPFCPEREHKYPRPDNLQRHVRAHHNDKSKDDPALREVLSQRIEGGTRGRRKRLGG